MKQPVSFKKNCNAALSAQWLNPGRDQMNTTTHQQHINILRNDKLFLLKCRGVDPSVSLSVSGTTTINVDHWQNQLRGLNNRKSVTLLNLR